MSYAESNNIDGLLMLIDFERAFDLISWKFMYHALYKFGFTKKKFIKWIKLFNTNIKASILQFGFLSDFLVLRGDVNKMIHLLLTCLVLCAQILCLLITQYRLIKGITNGNTNFKITQFADDTTLIMDVDESSLVSMLNTLEIFGTVSGLKMNTSKSKMIWIGRKKYCKKKRYMEHLDWSSENFNLLGLVFNVNLNLMPEINYKMAMKKNER